MTIHLYQQSKAEVFRLARKTLAKLSFKVHLDRDFDGLISSSKIITGPHVIFLDLKITQQRDCILLSLISNVFTGSSGTFIADAISEELFLETFHDFLGLQPPDNPMKLTMTDYAIAAAL